MKTPITVKMNGSGILLHHQDEGGFAEFYLTREEAVDLASAIEQELKNLDRSLAEWS